MRFHQFHLYSTQQSQVKITQGLAGRTLPAEHYLQQVVLQGAVLFNTGGADSASRQALNDYFISFAVNVGNELFF